MFAKNVHAFSSYSTTRHSLNKPKIFNVQLQTKCIVLRIRKILSQIRGVLTLKY